MKILKVINNNVIRSKDEKKHEVIILGKGIGFQKHNGDEVDIEKIEQIFRLSNAAKNQFEKMVEEIPYKYVKYTDEIVKEAENVVGGKLKKIFILH